MQYKVPQNVEREDRIVGPLTLKQVIICTIGFGLAYSTYVYLGKKNYGLEISIIPVLPITLLTVAIAFIKINDIPFTKWLLLLIEYWLNSQRRVWFKGADTIRVVSVPSQTKKKDKKQAEQEELDKKSKIHRLSKILDSADFRHLETKEDKLDKVEDENLIHKSFTGKEVNIEEKHKKLEQIAQNRKPEKEISKEEKPSLQKEINAEELNRGGEIKFK